MGAALLTIALRRKHGRDNVGVIAVPLLKIATEPKLGCDLGNAPGVVFRIEINEGSWLGGETFVSFDRAAVALLTAQGQAARLL